MATTSVTIRIPNDIHEIVKKVSVQFGCSLSFALNGFVADSLKTFDKDHLFYKELKNSQIQRDLHSQHLLLTKNRHLQFSVQNIAKSILQYAMQDFHLFGYINMEVVKDRFKDWDENYWKHLPKSTKTALAKQYGEVKVRFLDEQFLIDKVMALNKDPTRLLRIDQGGKHGSKRTAN